MLPRRPALRTVHLLILIPFPAAQIISGRSRFFDTETSLRKRLGMIRRGSAQDCFPKCPHLFRLLLEFRIGCSLCSCAGAARIYMNDSAKLSSACIQSIDAGNEQTFIRREEIPSTISRRTPRQTHNKRQLRVTPISLDGNGRGSQLEVIATA